MPDVVLGEFSTDVTPPAVTNPVPANGATGQTVDVNVEFDITDTETGLDTSSVVVVIDGTTAYSGGSFQNSYAGTFEDQGGGTWHMTLAAPSDYGWGDTLVVTVDAQDQAPLPNVMDQYSWSFQIEEDTTAPAVTGNNPTGLRVARDTAIEFDITDTQSGVDTSLFHVGVDLGAGFVNAILSGVVQAGFSGSIDDTGGGTLHVTLSPDPGPDWPNYQVVSVEVDAQDLQGNTMDQFAWNFTTTDNIAPVVSANTPTGTGVATAALIEFDISDDGWGVDLAFTRVTVGGVLAYDGAAGGFQTGFDGGGSAVTGDPGSYHFVIDADPDYAELTAYEVIVTTRDLDPGLRRVATFDGDTEVSENFDRWSGDFQIFDDDNATAAGFDGGAKEAETFDDWA